MTEREIFQMYDGTVTLEFLPNSHRYSQIIDGKKHRVSGVTTILRLLDKGEGLMRWAVNMALQATKEGKSHEEAKQAAFAKRDGAANTGKDVHSYIEAFMKDGTAISVTDEMRPSVLAFHEWHQNHSRFFAELQSEKRVFSKRYRYAGTFDARLKIGGQTVMLDFKTAEPEKEWKGKFPTGCLRGRIEHFLQLALYDIAYAEEFGEEHKADIYQVIYVTKKGELFVFEEEQTEPLKESAIRLVEFFHSFQTVCKANQFIKP